MAEKKKVGVKAKAAKQEAAAPEKKAAVKKKAAPKVAKKTPAASVKKATEPKPAAKATPGLPPESTKKHLELDEYLDEVRETAYHVYLKRYVENRPGDELSDWLEAEETVKRKYKM